MVIRSSKLSFKLLRAEIAIVIVRITPVMAKKALGSMLIEIAKKKEQTLFFMIFLISVTCVQMKSELMHFGMPVPECIGLNEAILVVKKDIGRLAAPSADQLITPQQLTNITFCWGG